MAHQSETSLSLKVIKAGESLEQRVTENDVWLIKFPYYKSKNTIPDLQKQIFDLNSFIEKTNKNATISILTSPVFAALFLSNLTPHGNLKLWIGVKLNKPYKSKLKLDQQHAALLVITRYHGSLRHSKTRIAYTYCPICKRTTKDYGGKKHLYHEYGTLMSDVWRDIDLDFDNNKFSQVTDRLKDLFGVKPYKYLKIIDLSKKYKPVEEKHQPVLKLETNAFIYNKSDHSRIVNGDSIEILKKIPSNSVDFCFADPPYNVNKKYENWNDGIDIKKYFEWCDKWLFELSRIIKPGKTIAILNIPQWTARHFKFLIDVLDYQEWILWEGLSLPVRMIMPAHYSILCFSKGKPKPIPGLARKSCSKLERESLSTLKELYCNRSGCINSRRKRNINDKALISNLWWDIHRLKHNSKRVDHPTQLPPTFMYRLISLFTDQNELVLDPFNGSGTTTLCAKNLNRKYFGIELSEKYYTLSIQRHKELENGIDPFRKQKKIPKSKNSYVKRLKTQKYEVDKKTLQLDVKKISVTIGKIPTREDVIKHSNYPIEYFDNYFINWGEVTAAARTTGMEKVERRNVYEKNQQLSLFEEKKITFKSND